MVFFRRAARYLALVALTLFTAGAVLAVLYSFWGETDLLSAWTGAPSPTAASTAVPAPTRTPVPPSATPTASNTPTPTPTATSTATPTPTATPTSTATYTPTPTPTRVPLPKRLIIPAIGLDAPIVEVGLEPDGTLSAPRDFLVVGWYALGPRPGEPGKSLVTGHVDHRYIGAAVFYHLRKLVPGDEIYVQTADGERLRFVVETTELYHKDTDRVAEIFAPTIEPSLTAITCEGVFDRVAQDYSHRRVVHARLVPGD